MNIYLIIIGLTGLILISGFFSGSETGMMSLNRYKLRHLAKKRHVQARRTQKLLKRPDRLLGVILIGNTFANILASSLVSVYADDAFGSIGVLIATIILTIVVLIVAEVMPKTIAALYPEKIAFPASLPLSFLLWLFYPIVWLVNMAANGILRIFGVRIKNQKQMDSLSKEEIHSVVHDSSSALTHKHKHMLLGVLELESIRVSDVMIPRHKVEAIDIADQKNFIYNVIQASHSILLIYENDLDNLLGILPVKNALKFISNPKAVNIEDIRSVIAEPYYVPENASLQTQLFNFQRKGCRFSVVVDEYGGIEGIITAEDILEEIVGEFSDTFEVKSFIQPAEDGSFVTSGSTTIRELSRHANLHFPKATSKTLSGFIMEFLEVIPDGRCCFKSTHYIIEVMSVENNMIHQARISPLKSNFLKS